MNQIATLDPLSREYSSGWRTYLRKKELRMALVCFGGASLAVYMHGITKEILKLVRASSALHGIVDRTERSSAAFFDSRDPSDPEYDTEAFYFDLLRDIGRTVELRVIVDIVAGASAGGINSVMLARALCHDLPMGRLRDLWLENADVTKLLAPEARAHRWSKWFLRPIFWFAEAAGLQPIDDPEVRSKLSLFIRSRWFQPPLDGQRMTALMYEGAVAMGAPRSQVSSLLPTRQALDLFVAVTDFYGCQRVVQIHDPPVVHEREYRHVIHFRYRRHTNGVVESDFELANAPALAFAARATSSIPGAFPPARILEVDQFLRDRSITWPRRAEFIKREFKRYAEVNVDVTSVPFVDGGVLNSRPFREAIAAIWGRAAFREVDRRVVYVDPSPMPPVLPTHHGMPKFFPTLKGAMSDIPLAEPVAEELSWITRFNERTRRLRAIIENARPHISQLVKELMTCDGDEPPSEAMIRSCREQANSRAARDAGFAFEAYVRLKLASARSFVGLLIMAIRNVRSDSPFARAIMEIIDAWAIQAGATYQPTLDRSLEAETVVESAATPTWVAFLLAFDVDYRRRRLRFLIEGQNRLYQNIESQGIEGIDTAAIDQLKRGFYECYETLEQNEIVASFNSTTCNLVEDIFREAPSPAEIREIGKYAQSFVARHKIQIDLLIERLGSDIDLKAGTREIDGLLAQTQGWPPMAMQEVLVNYLGFPFWDVLTFPLMPWGEAGEFNEIQVDRISAQDAVAVNKLGTFRLMGAAFNQFAAFLSRAYRENDYLLGRLHAVDRLIDIVSDAAGAEFRGGYDLTTLKRRAFLRILDAEEPYLSKCKTIIAELRNALQASS